MQKPQALYEYLWKNRIRVKDFADKMHITPAFLSKYLNGKYRFSEKTARLVERFSNGEVTADQVLKENPIVD